METTRILADRYRLEGQLARGGMADVFEAEDTLLGRRVAVKILHPQFAADEAFVRRFGREAQAAANLSHPNIVSIFDFGQDEHTYFIVMELIDGKTLRDIRRNEGPMLPRRAAEIAAESAAALSVAHAAGVFHRDITAANIMLTGDGSTKVTDFGIARALDDSEELTRTGAVIGTATYFSPEQAQGLPADERSDLYSLGVVLYEMVAGTPPFTGESPVSVAYQHVSEHAPPPSAINPDVPPDLEAIILRALEKNPAERYQTAEEFRGDLLRFLRGETPTATTPVVDAATVMLTAPPPATVPPDETARHVAYGVEEATPRNQQQMYLIGIIGLLVVLAIAIFAVTRLTSGADSPNLVEVPPLAGMTPNDAFAALGALDLEVRQRDEANDAVEPGRVIGTDPVAGSMVELESVVVVVVSTGPQQFPVPNVINQTEEEARDRIAQQLLEVGTVTFVASDVVPEGRVVDQAPRGGAPAVPGTTVDLEISAGPSVLTVPPLVNLTEANAIRTLTEEGFRVIESREDFSPDVLPGFVIGTEPAEGTLVPRDSTITVIVSKGPPPVEIPDLLGETVADATATLEALGLVLIVDDATVPVSALSGLDGRVAEQSPAVGEVVDVGAAVTVLLGEIQVVTVPDLTNLTEAEAQQQLSDLGLGYQVTGTEEVEEGLVGTVRFQAPLPGDEVPEGTVVGVVIGVPVTTTTTTSTTTTTTTTTQP